MATQKKQFKNTLTINKMKQNEKIKVSILCITYNQENFIRQTLESFVTQKTNFNFEVIIGDDHSTDKTTDIIREFEKKFPKIIKPIYRDKNIGISNNLFDIFQKASGEYISMCAGDDFFTDTKKIQTQSDFLDKNPDCSLCFHLTKVFFENNEEKETLFPDLNKINEFTLKALLEDNFLQANSVMYRKTDYKDLPSDIIPEDWYLHLYHAKNGKIGFINKVMSAYRKHEGSIWWHTYKNADKVIEKQGIKQFKMYLELLKLFSEDKEYIKIINSHIENLLNHIIKVDRNNHNTKLIEELFKKYPQTIGQYLIDTNQKLHETYNNKTELDQIKSSNFFKLWRNYCKIKDIFKK